MARILLVDDDSGVLDLVGAVLRSHAYDVVTAGDGVKALELINSDEHFDLMLSDIDMSPLNGIALLRRVCIERPAMSVVMLTGNASLETATEALKLGAYDYILKPLDPDEFLSTVARALKHGKSFKEKTALKIELGKKYFLENIIAESDQMRNVCETIKKVALIDVPVAICGESGTGKTLVARTIHSQGPRKNKPFLAIDCATLPTPLLELVLFGHAMGAPLTGDAPPRAGLLESAKGGTVLLEEIGSLPLSLQKRLIVAVKTRKFQRVGGNEVIDLDARILVTSNMPLAELLKENMISEEMHSLLSSIPIEIRQVRERPQDIIPLAYHILRSESAADDQPLPTISQEVREILESYSWPGNVAELANAIRHAISCATDNMITEDFLPSEITAAYSAKPRKKPDEDDLKGKSLRAFINSKREEYLDKLRPSARKTEAAASNNAAISAPRPTRFGPKIRFAPAEPDDDPASKIKWRG